MKKLYYLMVLVVILGLVLTGCLLSNVGQVPTTEQSKLDGIIKANGTYTGPVTLLAGQNIDVGTVEVWNDGVNLYVKYVTTGCWEIAETHLHVASSKDGIPHTNKGNPIPGQFAYSTYHDPWVTEYTYEIDLEWDPCEELCIAAHAVVWDTCSQPCFNVYSDATETFSAYGGLACSDTLIRTGIAVPAWEHSAWIHSPTYTLGDWIWESEYCVNPICGDVVDFEKTFSIPGYPISGEIKITVDNAYEIFLNGSSVASVGLFGDWRNSNLIDDFVQSGHVGEVNTYTLSGLISGDNLLRFECANEYQNTDDIDFKTGDYEPEGTVLNNPGGLIYETEICYYDHEETAWGDGERFVKKGNWATYFTYTIPCLEPVLVNGSFEYPEVTNLVPSGNIWDAYESVQGWNIENYDSSEADSAKLEIHKDVNDWLAHEGFQYVELDSDHPTCISQDINTCPCADYTITFWYSPRPGIADNRLMVYWGDDFIWDTGNISGVDLTYTNWTEKTLIVSTTSLLTLLKFCEVGPDDSLGMFLDDITISLATP